ncbi:hypothetical protein PV328_010339 [Microctonus aethiopoides]|uniref:Uncharacterized protein n=1 Tax=Microctonus aethiopoides TaxID=144406 RepID=A0AA39FHI7_9HYME|nr:hypothetical protein PV328_010339 [Microctonus aethiopoides]
MPPRKSSESYSIKNIDQILHVSLVRLNIPESKSSESKINNLHKNFNSVTNNSHDPGDDSDYDSHSSSSNISTFSNQSWFIDEGQPVTETSESDECMTDDSDDSEDSIIESIKRCAKKRKTDGKETKTSKKIRWTEYEINTTSTVFEHNLTNMKLPSSHEIREFLKNHPKIIRTEAQIRTWIHNQYKVRQQRSRY